MKSRNSGCGRFGRDLNSGWNWVPTIHGWSASSPISTRRPSGERPLETSPAAAEPVAVLVVELVAVAVPLEDDRLAVGAAAARGARHELARIDAQPHRAALVRDVLLLGQQVDHRVAA